MTVGEKRLWFELRQFRRLHGVHARRQVPIGRYVADFAIHDKGLVIEIDGEHHLFAAQIAWDRERDGWLTTQGYRVLRFTSTELAQRFDGCIKEILRELGVNSD
jgi:very-short-patch-repair endonuclease